MLNEKLVSSNAVIAKIIADNDLKEDEIRITDIKQWIGEAMEFIGAFNQFDRKNVIVPIKGHQAALPCDVHQLDQVGYSYAGGCEHDCWLPMFKSSTALRTITNTCCDKPEMFIHDTVMFGIVKNLYNLADDASALAIMNKNPNIRQTLADLINMHTTPWEASLGYRPIRAMLGYTTKPGYIVTAMPCGHVRISYYAIPTDEDGMPLIPDHQSYMEAIYWYVTKKLMYPKYVKGLINRQVYYDMQSSWNYYRKQAYGEAMMPTVDDLESMKNTWNTLMPEIYDHDNFFTSTGAPAQHYHSYGNHYHKRIY